MRVFLTGSSSSIGREMSARLVNAGHEVVKAGGSESTIWKLGDEFPAHIHADALIHLAHDRSMTLEQNTSAVEILTRSFGGYVIFLSSISSHLNSKSVYGKSKYLSEQIFLQNGGLVLRAGVVCGQNVEGIYRTLYQLISKFRIVPVPFAGTPRLFITQIDDLCQEVLAHLQRKTTGVILAAHPWPISLNSLIKSIVSVTDKKKLLLSIPIYLTNFGLRLGVLMRINHPLVDSLRSLESEISLIELSALEPTITNFRSF